MYDHDDHDHDHDHSDHAKTQAKIGVKMEVKMERGERMAGPQEEASDLTSSRSLQIVITLVITMIISGGE